VEVDVDELGHNRAKNVQHSPLLRVDVPKMQLSDYLIDVVKFVDGEILESRELSSLAVDLEEYMLVCQVCHLDHVFDGIEGPCTSLSDRSHAYTAKAVIVVV
jgi:hypothetical protein